MSTMKSPSKVSNLQDSTNIYFRNLDTLNFMKKLNKIRERENQFLEPKKTHKKNVNSMGNSKFTF